MDSDPVEIRRMEPADAAALVRCFERCYGDTYHADRFHDPEELAARLADGRLRSVVAVSPRVGVVAHMGLTLGAAQGFTAEAGNTVVDPRYRGQHLAARLAAELIELARATGLVGFVHYPTTAHPVMQKLSVQGRGVEVGLLFEYIPAETRYLGFEGSAPAGRVAVVTVYEPLADAPARRVQLPARHLALARKLYAQAGLEREPAAPAPLPDAPTRLAVDFEERRGLLRISVEAPGADLRQRVAAETSRRPEAPALVDVSLGHAAAESATEALAADGFCFGALLPEYTPAGDVLRLQRPVAPAAELDLATPGGRALLAYIEAERAAR